MLTWTARPRLTATLLLAGGLLALAGHGTPGNHAIPAPAHVRHRPVDEGCREEPAPLPAAAASCSALATASR